MSVLQSGFSGKGLAGPPHPPPHRGEAFQVLQVRARVCRARYSQQALKNQRWDGKAALCCGGGVDVGVLGSVLDRLHFGRMIVSFHGGVKCLGWF